MPQFLDPNAEELNSLRRVNKKVVAANKRRFKGVETTIGLVGDLQDKYTFVYEKMVEILVSLGEISNQLQLGHTAPQGVGSKAIDRFIGGTSAVLKATKLLLNYMTQQVPSISIFPTEQQQTISGLNDQIVAAVMEIDQLSTNFLDQNVLDRFRSVLSTFKTDLMLLQQRLEGLQGDMGTGSVGEAFGTTPSGKPQPQRRPAKEKAPATPATPATPKKETKRQKEAREKREAKAAAKDRGQVEGVMRDMLMDVEETSGGGYGGGYGTQIRMSGHMPSRFL